MENKVIAISRQFDSGGRAIGKKVAEELNISTKTVDAQLQKALTRLKEALLTE